MSSNTREVYVGNGITKQVNPSNDIRYFLDMDKLEELFNNNPEAEIAVGATGDWFFTAQTIEGKEEFERIKKHEKYILRSSDWSRFSIDQEEDCTVEVPLKYAKLGINEGIDIMKRKFEIWVPRLFDECMQKMKYEQIKPLSEELKAVINKHIEKQEVK